jgi:hypothetical protein
MKRTDRTTWRHWVDAWLSGSPRGSAEALAAEDGMATSALELDHDREEAIRPLGPTRFLDLSAAAGAARPAALGG